MTQQTTNETHQSPTVDLDASKSLDRIRQRLGSLTAPAQTVQMKTPESPMAATVPFDSPSVTAPIGQRTTPTPIQQAATARFMQSTSSLEGQSFPGTRALDAPTVPLPSSPPTMPIGAPAPIPFPSQTATVPFAGQPAHAADIASTVPFPAPSDMSAGAATVPFGGTGTFPPSISETAPISSATVPIGADISVTAETVPFGNAPTQFGADTAAFAGGATMPMTGTGTLTAQIGGRGATNDFILDSVQSGEEGPGDYTLALTGGRPTAEFELHQEISRLREQCQADPNDPDALLELALALSDSGNRLEAESTLRRLLNLYESNGDEEQATRVRRLIGDVSTRAIDDPNEQTQRMASGPTEQFRTRTGTLGLRNAAVRDGRVPVKEKVDEREKPVFSSRDILFIEDLLSADSINEAARPFWDESEAYRLKGKYRAASDALQMAIALDSSVGLMQIRQSELLLKLGHKRKARTAIDAIERYEPLFGVSIPAWAYARLRIHAEPYDLAKVQRLVDQLIQVQRADIAAPYAARLIDLLYQSGKVQEAIDYSNRICVMVPGNTSLALEASLLELRNRDANRARERWEFALRNGADPLVAKAAMAALIADGAEAQHWKMLADVLPVYRADGASIHFEAYSRSAEVIGPNPVTKAGEALFVRRPVSAKMRSALGAAAGDRAGSPVGRASTAAALVHLLQQNGGGDEYLAAIRTTLSLFTDARIPGDTNWIGLLGFEPSIVELSFELGQELARAGDYAGAVDVLRQGHQLDKASPELNQALAEAYARTNQLGSALTILDELAMAHRKEGRLEEMAAVLRQMSQLAPANIKVKTRLVDAYLQRGFVAEARAELIQRADLEESAGQKKEAIVSLQRAADLSWTLGYPQEAFNLYDRILVLDPEDVGNRSALVNLFLQVGRLSEAAEHQRAVVDLALKNGRKHEAVAALHQVIGLTPDDMTAYYQLAEQLGTMGEYHQAEKVYRRIVLMNPDDAVAQAKATAMAALREQAAGIAAS